MEQHKTNVLPVGHLIDPEDLRDPIEFLRTQHEEQRTFCRRLNDLVDDLAGEESPAEASSLLDFLLGEMSLNMLAEEITLVPLLYDRCTREDMLTAMVRDTWKAHNLIALLLPAVGYGLGSLSDGQIPEKPLDFIFRSLEFSDYVEWHVDRENHTLIPLARFRLTTEDYVWLGQALARQHGLPYPSGWEPAEPGARPRPPDEAPTGGIREARSRSDWRARKAALFGRLH